MSEPRTEAGQALVESHEHYDVCRDPDCLKRQEEFAAEVVKVEVEARQRLDALEKVAEAARKLLVSADSYERETKARGVWRGGGQQPDEMIVRSIQASLREPLAALRADDE